MWNHEEIVSGNKLRSDLSAPVWGIGQLIFGFEGFKTNSSDTLNTMVRVQVPEWINERLAIEYQVSGKCRLYKQTKLWKTLTEIWSLQALKFTTTGTLFYSPCLYHEINEIWKQKNLYGSPFLQAHQNDVSVARKWFANNLFPEIHCVFMKKSLYVSSSLLLKFFVDLEKWEKFWIAFFNLFKCISRVSEKNDT